MFTSVVFLPGSPCLRLHEAPSNWIFWVKATSMPLTRPESMDPQAACTGQCPGRSVSDFPSRAVRGHKSATTSIKPSISSTGMSGTQGQVTPFQSLGWETIAPWTELALSLSTNMTASEPSPTRSFPYRLWLFSHPPQQSSVLSTQTVGPTMPSVFPY